MGFFELFAAALTGFYALLPNFGLAIVLLTILVRLILLPLSIKQTKSQREMARIQPEVKKLQQKYKGDRQKMNEAMMALYKEHGVNPFGGCLPLLLQFPVLIGLYYVVRSPLRYMGFGPPEGAGNADAVALSEHVRRRASELEPLPGIMEALQNSALAEGLHDAGLTLNRFLGFLRLDCYPSQVLGGKGSAALPDAACGGGFVDFVPYALLIAVMGFTTWYQSKQMQAKQPADNPQAQQMQMFMRIMPIFLMVLAYNFPTGVLLYWITTNVWTIAQQQLILGRIPHLDPLTSDGKAGGKAVAKPEAPKRPAPQQPAQGNGSTRSANAKTPANRKKRKR